MSHSVFKGREATLNKAIMETLAFDPGLIRSELTKKVKEIPYVIERIEKIEKFKVVPSTVSRRVEALKNEGWLKESGRREVPLFQGATTPEYAPTYRGVILIFLESKKVQENFLKVFKLFMIGSGVESTSTLQDFFQLLEFLKEELPKVIFQKFWVEGVRKDFSKLNLENLTDEEITEQLLSGTFLSITETYIDSEKVQKEWKRLLGRRYGQVRRRMRRHLRKLKPIIPTLRIWEKEHERQAVELRWLIEAIEKADQKG